MTAIDRILVVGGLATALSSAGFATFMLMGRAHEPYIVGMQYFSIFAQPNRTLEAQAARPPSGLDFTPTGSVARSDPAPAPLRQVDGPRRLVAISDGRAWLRTGQSFSEIRAGDALPGLGEIRSISRVRGVWTIVMSNGTMIRTGENAAEGRFERPMIFGP